MDIFTLNIVVCTCQLQTPVSLPTLPLVTKSLFSNLSASVLNHQTVTQVSQYSPVLINPATCTRWLTCHSRACQTFKLASPMTAATCLAFQKTTIKPSPLLPQISSITIGPSASLMVLCGEMRLQNCGQVILSNGYCPPELLVSPYLLNTMKPAF